MMELILGAALLTSGSSVDVSSLLDCEGSKQIIENLQKSRAQYQEELIEVIKENTEPQCYERSENT
jgi:hypothetical protein|tara:strand:- start:228 stop:425 length:198 start_codon:yes stop_codon:yes gene_type:complete